MIRLFEDLPNGKEIKENAFTLDEIRSKLSGIFENDIEFREAGILELILCLSNEIHDLKQELKNKKQ
jgi:hypothetical protein